MTSSNRMSRRDFIKVTIGAIGGVMGVLLGVPVVGYLLQPAFRKQAAEAWIPIGKLEAFTIGIPSPFSFTRTKVNGWERTATSYGGFVLRRSEDPKEILILSSRCTHLSCRVNWNEAAQGYLCPCHDAKFSIEGEVLSGPPPEPLERYNEFKVDEDGNLLIFFEEA
ncbi:MAG: ubiquinol-cytochrome c reductase iron-sulfur subunit [Anaerolineales bacterium]|nr:ubiquinol-cytochrome c reductase iron-sulfur subunit [Anaerolineales bacterium]